MSVGAGTHMCVCAGNTHACVRGTHMCVCVRGTHMCVCGEHTCVCAGGTHMCVCGEHTCVCAGNTHVCPVSLGLKKSWLVDFTCKSVQVAENQPCDRYTGFPVGSFDVDEMKSSRERLDADAVAPVHDRAARRPTAAGGFPPPSLEVPWRNWICGPGCCSTLTATETMF